MKKFEHILRYTVIMLATFCAFGFGSWMCTGCKTAQGSSSDSSTSSSVVKTDSVGKAVVSSVNHDVNTEHSHTEKDSMVALPGSEVDWVFNQADLQPAVDMHGDTVGREYHKDSGAVHGNVTVGKNGKVRFKCAEDSLRYVCLRLVRDSIAVRNFLDSSLNVVLDSWHSEIKDSVSTASSVVIVDKKKGFFARIGSSLWNVCGWIGIACIVVFIFRFIIKKAV